MHNFQILDAEQAKSPSLCCEYLRFLCRNKEEEENTRKKFSDLLLFAFEQCC